VPLKSIYELCVCTAIVLALILIATIWHLGERSMIACVFLGAFFIHTGSRPPRRHLFAAVLAGVCFAGAYTLLGGGLGTTVLVAVLGAGAFLGVGSLAVMSCYMVWTGSRTYRLVLRDAVMLPIFSLVAGLAMNWINGHALPSYDYFLHAFDLTLGTPGRLVARWFQALPWLAASASVVYSSLLIFPPLYHAWALHRGVRSRMNLMKAFVVGGVCGFILYQVCPAIGPLYVFKDRFPEHMPSLNEFTMQVFASKSVHNAMPSMHMAWALLVWWTALGIGRLATAIATGFVALTALATLGFGEHYLIDLIVAVPLVILIEGICSKRQKQIIAGAAVVLGWMLFLRLGLTVHVPAAANWALVLATLAMPLMPMTIEVVRRRTWQDGPGRLYAQDARGTGCQPEGALRDRGARDSRTPSCVGADQSPGLRHLPQ
jgi:hypothetical protein